ncbi:hypothetical protein KDL44_13620 [bacterium]|nr:hypothetical protein [bacterium]
MTDSAGLRHEGKPSYSMSDLQRITAGELRGRLARIDNPHARAIAERLWKAVERQFTNQYGQLMLKDHHTLRRMAAGGVQQRLLTRLEELRRLDIGDIVAEGPSRMQQALESLHPFVRFLHPPLSLKHSAESAEHLLRYLEFHENPGQTVPESFRRSWLFVSGMFAFLIMPMLILVMWIDFVREQRWLVIVVMFIAITGVLLSAIQLAGFGRLRTLSLYVSFTDEFIGMDGERDADSGEPGAERA